MNEWQLCPLCRGQQIIPISAGCTRTCYICNGTGLILRPGSTEEKCSYDKPPFIIIDGRSREVICPQCRSKFRII